MALPVSHHPAAQAVAQNYQTLAASLPGYEHRAEQYKLTVEIAQAIADREHLVAQAPTGTGKSFAVLLALLASLKADEKAVIATANNNLLEQYCKKDLPFLEKFFPVKWARAKGKSNYLCIDKASEVYPGQQVLFQGGSGSNNAALGKWVQDTKTGDREEISFQVKEDDWAKVAADESCTGKKCPFYEECHWYAAKNRMYNAQIVVTNHDVLLLDAFNPEWELLPLHEVVVVDEAHELEAKAVSRMEQGLSSAKVYRMIDRAAKKYDLAALTVNHAATRYFDAFQAILPPGADKTAVFATPLLQDLTNYFTEAVDQFRAQVQAVKVEGDREKKEKEHLVRTLRDLSKAANKAITHHDLKASWVERPDAKNNSVKVVSLPIQVGGKLNGVLFAPEHGKTVVCLSATLGATGRVEYETDPATGGIRPKPQFGFFRKRVGLLEAREFICPSPFDYAKNCALYLPDCPHSDPKSEAWFQWFLDQVVDLVEASQGGALILTTASKPIKPIVDRLSACTGYPVKGQGAGVGNGQLVDWFKKTPNAVLVGTASFWQGVSVEGDQCKLVVIDKIPFTPHTDPFQQAQEKWYDADPERKKRKFYELQIHPAKILLAQGFGRLIRTKTDRGVVALMDPRFTKSKYGGQLLSALPKVPILKALNDFRLTRLLR